MSEIPMLHPVSKDTMDHYALNEGVLAINVDFTSITDAASFVEYIRANPDKILGATTGGTTIAENRETWEPERNGKRNPVKGEQYFAGARPSIKATLIELTAANTKLASGAADIEDEGTTYVKVNPRAEFKESDYASNAVWFTNFGKKGIIMTILDNALCTKGINWSIDDKKVATSEIELIGHAENALFDDSLPIHYGVLTNAA